jgi:hypothetical protein
MRLQANVLTRQLRRAFLKLKKDTITAQSFVRRFLVYTSYRCLKLERAQLIRDISGINTKLTDVSQKAALYFQNFDGVGGNTVSSLPLPQTNRRIERTKVEGRDESKCWQRNLSRWNKT